MPAEPESALTETFATRPVDVRNVELIRLALQIIIGGCLLMMAAMPLLAPGRPPLLAPSVLLLILASIALKQVNAGHPGRGLRVFLYGSWAAVTATTVFNNGVYGNLIFAYPVLIIFGGWLFGPRGALHFAVLSIAAELALATAQTTGWLAPANLAPPAYYAASHVISLVAMTAMAILLAKSNRRHVDQIRSLSEQLAQRLETLARREAQLDLVIENVPAMIALYDIQRRCLFANSAYASQFGWTTASVVGRHVGEIVGGDGYAAIVHQVDQVSLGRRAHYRRTVHAGGGRECQIDVALLPHRDEGGTVRGFFVMIQDITERERAANELRQSEAKFLKIFQASPVAISLSRLKDGRFIDINDAYLRNYGWSREELIGRTSVDIGLWPHDAARARWVAELRATRGSRDYETVLMDRTGTAHSVLISGEIVALDGEECTIALIVDITARKRVEEEVRRLNAELEDRVRQRTADLTAANKELESFAYSISHDLRAPLRGIDGFSRLLQEDYGDRLDAQGHDYLARVRRATQRLGTLIDHILELSRLTRHEMRAEAVDMARIAREVFEDLRKSQPERRVDFQVGPIAPARGDPQMLRVLLENLIDNAWKYTGRTDPARIEFGCRVDHDGTGICEYYVRDNGAGFDMAYAGKLFGPFQRLHKIEDFDGSGIGLASASRIVRRHGGRIWAQGAPGEGATFYFTIPPTPPKGSAPADKEESRPSS